MSSIDAVKSDKEDGVVSPTAAETVVNCNHSSSAGAADTNDAELGGVRGQGQAVNTTVRYRSERRRWSNLELYLIIVCIVLLLTSIALAAITISFSLIQTGQSSVLLVL